MWQRSSYGAGVGVRGPQQPPDYYQLGGMRDAAHERFNGPSWRPQEERAPQRDPPPSMAARPKYLIPASLPSTTARDGPEAPPAGYSNHNGREPARFPPPDRTAGAFNSRAAAGPPPPPPPGRPMASPPGPSMRSPPAHHSAGYGPPRPSGPGPRDSQRPRSHSYPPGGAAASMGRYGPSQPPPPPPAGRRPFSPPPPPPRSSMSHFTIDRRPAPWPHAERRGPPGPGAANGHGSARPAAAADSDSGVARVRRMLMAKLQGVRGGGGRELHHDDAGLEADEIPSMEVSPPNGQAVPANYDSETASGSGGSSGASPTKPDGEVDAHGRLIVPARLEKEYTEVVQGPHMHPREGDGRAPLQNPVQPPRPGETYAERVFAELAAKLREEELEQQQAKAVDVPSNGLSPSADQAGFTPDHAGSPPLSPPETISKAVVVTKKKKKVTLALPDEPPARPVKTKRQGGKSRAAEGVVEDAVQSPTAAKAPRGKRPIESSPKARPAKITKVEHELELDVVTDTSRKPSTAAKKTSPTAAKTTTVSSILEGAVTTGKTKKSKKQQGGDDTLFPEYYCSLCEVEEPCKSSYKVHKSSHEVCKVEGCLFKGCKAVLERHFDFVHGRFSREGYQTVSVQVDLTQAPQNFRILVGHDHEPGSPLLEDWLRRRRERYPTSARIKQQAAKAARMSERLKRRDARMRTNESHEPEGPTWWCDTCEADFISDEEYLNHLELHEHCARPGCFHYQASSSALWLHEDYVHGKYAAAAQEAAGNERGWTEVERDGRAFNILVGEDPVEVEIWREERRERFPRLPRPQASPPADEEGEGEDEMQIDGQGSDSKGTEGEEEEEEEIEDEDDDEDED